MRKGLIEMDWTADTQRIGLGLDTSVRKIGLHATCQEKKDFIFAANWRVNCSFWRRRQIFKVTFYGV